MTEALCVIVTVIVLAVGTVTHPERARCPRGWALVEGIRRDGTFACYPPVVGGDDDVLTGHITSVQLPGRIVGRIYCRAGTQPIIRFDGATVGCR